MTIGNQTQQIKHDITEDACFGSNQTQETYPTKSRLTSRLTSCSTSAPSLL